MNEVIKDYLWTFNVEGIDNSRLYDTCNYVESFLFKKLPEPEGDNFYGNFTSYHHEKYNLFSFVSVELHKLYYHICSKTSLVLEESIPYYIRCWPNIFRQGMNIDWHDHWEARARSYHGFYCVNTEGIYPSYTDYRVPGHPEVRIPSKDGLLVFGKSAGDVHRSSEWNNSGKHRVTIAFDIIPGPALHYDYSSYHDQFLYTNYIPIFKPYNI